MMSRYQFTAMHLEKVLLKNQMLLAKKGIIVLIKSKCERHEDYNEADPYEYNEMLGCPSCEKDILNLRKEKVIVDLSDSKEPAGRSVEIW